MAGTRLSIGRVVMPLALAAGLAGAYNVLSDNTALQAQAAATACTGAKPPCRPALARLMRTPFSQELDYRVSGKTVQVTCKRSIVLVGPYTCFRAEPVTAGP
jgi:hypothetical protein